MNCTVHCTSPAAPPNMTTRCSLYSFVPLALLCCRHMPCITLHSPRPRTSNRHSHPVDAEAHGSKRPQVFKNFWVDELIGDLPPHATLKGSAIAAGSWCYKGVPGIRFFCT